MLSAFHNWHQILVSTLYPTCFILYYPHNAIIFTGIAFTQAACGPYKTSVIEEADFFVVTSVATHELGHK